MNRHFTLTIAALSATVVFCQAAVAAPIIISPTVVSNSPSQGAAGATVYLGDVSADDLLSFSVSGAPTLVSGGTYATNAAGVVQDAGAIGISTGGSVLDIFSGFTAGSLIATLNGTNSVQVFATSLGNGAGSSTPPTSLTYTGSLASLFSLTSQHLAGATLNFRVDDSGYADNDGAFLLQSTDAGGSAAQAVAAVPEPATWAMMLLGFGAMGGMLRTRGRATARIRFA